MVGQLAAPGRAITEFVLPLYRDTDFAYALAAVMVFMAAFILVIALFAHAFRMSAIGRRQRLLSQNITGPGTGPGGDGLSPHELHFREDFDRISTVMGASDAFATPLALAWRNYTKTFSKGPEGPVTTPFRPRFFLLPATMGSGFLDFCANLFVAIGLLATFVGLVAALTFASTGMQSGSAEEMQLAVQDLLGASASKFVTSIAGVGLSIILRLTDRLLDNREASAAEGLCNSLEACLRIRLAS